MFAFFPLESGVPWPYGPGDPIAAIGRGYDTRQAAESAGRAFFAVLVDPLRLPLRCAVVEIDGSGRQVGAASLVAVRDPNPGGPDRWAIRREGERTIIERGGEGDPWDGPRPPGDRAEIDTDAIRSGAWSIRREGSGGDAVRILAAGVEAYEEQDAFFSVENWDALAKLQTLAKEFKAAVARPYPGDPRPLAEARLIALRAEKPAADNFVTAAL